MTTIFISDLHLEASNTHTAQLFFNFMQNVAPKADALYILGDLFEAWIGDDHRTAFTSAVKNAIQRVAKNIPVYFMHGNRDFLIGETFAQESGCVLLKQPTTIDLYGTKTLLLHGDTLCIDDLAYQKARLKMIDPAFQHSLLAKPLFMRKLLALYYRYRSHQHKSNIQSIIMDANAQEIRRVMALYHLPLLIHGHTHRPGFHLFEQDGDFKQRIVLSDWSREQGNYLSCHADGKRELVYFKELIAQQ